MKNDRLYQLLVTKMHEVAVVPPQELGPLTFLYKKMVPYFKFYPWRSAGIISMLATFLLYLLLGSTLVTIASILQFGF